MAFYTKKPVTIEAIQFTHDNISECLAFIGDSVKGANGNPTPKIVIATLEGDHNATVGDYIIKGVKGEFYPCKPDIFEMTYDKAEVE